ncbi:glycoside hydrolase/deacetylase, partial [Anaeromyces robustus]
MHFNKILKLLLLSSSLYTTTNAKLASIYNKCNKPGVVALTIDDGPHSKLTPKVLDLLKANDIKATFFINGKNFGSDIENSEETKSILKRQIKEGHDIGSHTFYHKDCFPAYDDGTLKENIERLQNGIEKVIGRIPRFFRPPEGQGGFSEEYYFGTYDYDIILWNGDTEDWKCDGSSLTYKDAIKSLEYSMGSSKADKSKDSFIILVHDVHEYSVNTIIPEVIKYVKNLGYKFVPLSECIG